MALGSFINPIPTDYISTDKLGVVNGIVPLNANKKIESIYLPNLVDSNYVMSDDIANLNTTQTWASEQTYNYDDYELEVDDTIKNIACGFKACRGLFNQLFIDKFVFTKPKDNSVSSQNVKNIEIAEIIPFYAYDGYHTVTPTKDSTGAVTTKGSSNLLNLEVVAGITSDGGLVLKSSTPNSTKHFKLMVDDTGTISVTEYTIPEGY